LEGEGEERRLADGEVPDEGKLLFLAKILGFQCSYLSYWVRVISNVRGFALPPPTNISHDEDR
jgi:hypothetical protein